VIADGEVRSQCHRDGEVENAEHVPRLDAAADGAALAIGVGNRGADNPP
jgi:hypothetical protein